MGNIQKSQPSVEDDHVDELGLIERAEIASMRSERWDWPSKEAVAGGYD
jgi:hypothetical protein